jgi:sugar phosphate isomerase/epimerase
MSDDFLIALCDAFPPERLGITFDFCHYGVGRRHDYVQAVAKLGHRIRHIHFSDSDLESSELHFAPGDGLMDIDSLVSAFSAIGYTGTLALDLYSNPTPSAAARRSAPRMTDAVQRLCKPSVAR